MVAQAGSAPAISWLWAKWVKLTSLPRKFFFYHLSFPMKTSPQNQPSIFVCHHCHLSCHQPIVAIKLHGPMPGELKEEKLTQASFNSLSSLSSSCLSTTSKLQALHKKKAQLSSLWSAPGLMTSWLTWAWSHDDLNPASMKASWTSSQTSFHHQITSIVKELCGVSHHHADNHIKLEDFWQPQSCGFSNLEVSTTAIQTTIYLLF